MIRYNRHIQPVECCCLDPKVGTGIIVFLYLLNATFYISIGSRKYAILSANERQMSHEIAYQTKVICIVQWVYGGW